MSSEEHRDQSADVDRCAARLQEAGNPDDAVALTANGDVHAAAAPPLEKESVAACTSNRIASPVIPIGNLPIMDAAIVCFRSRGSSSAA